MQQDVSTHEARESDQSKITHMLAAAFNEDPALSFIFPDPEIRLARAPTCFNIIYQSDIQRGVCFVTDQCEAAALWRAPGHETSSILETLQYAWPWLKVTQGALGRALLYHAACDSHHPKEPHWYLHIAGCLPTQQEQGHGGAVIKAGIARANHAGLSAYLETANEKNLAFYGALGFVINANGQ